MIALDRVSKRLLPMEQAINKHTPTGGVVNPITKLSTTITPKCRGSTPICIIKGRSTGVRMISSPLL
jgi:hypothetical protein